MKTKAYKIYSQNGQDYLEISEQPGNVSLKVKTSNSGVITLNREGWKDLMGIDYDIKINDEVSFDDCCDVSKLKLPMADATINKLPEEI